MIDRYGIPPELVPDFIGLKGDTSDNIPGVPGIGDKTAADLLQRFGSLEQVLDSIDEISGAKRKQNLIEHADDARISKQLATAKRDIPLDLDVGEFVSAPPDRSRLREVFREFELRDPLRRLEEALGSADAAAPAPAAEQALGARVRAGRLSDVSALPGDAEVAVAVRAPETPEGALFGDDATSGASASTSDGRQRGRGRRLRATRGSGCRDRQPAGDRPRRQVAGPGARRRWPTTRRWRPTCSSRPAGPTRSASCARSVAWPPTSRTRPAPTRVSCRRWPPGSARRSAAAG